MESFFLLNGNVLKEESFALQFFFYTRMLRPKRKAALLVIEKLAPSSTPKEKKKKDDTKRMGLISPDSYDYSRRWPEEIETFQKWVVNLQEVSLHSSSSSSPFKLFSEELAKVTGKMDNLTIASSSSARTPTLSPIIILGNCKQLHNIVLEGPGATSTDICIRSVMKAIKKATGEDGTQLDFTQEPIARCFNDGPCMKRCRSEDNTYPYECLPLSTTLYNKLSQIFQIGTAAYEMQLEQEARAGNNTSETIPLISYLVFSKNALCSLVVSNRESSLLLNKQKGKVKFLASSSGRKVLVLL